MAVSVYLLLLVAVSASFASDVPVLMWSPDRPLSDLPQVQPFDQVSQDTFHSNYLAHLLGKQSNVIIAFVQDKLSIDDISKYGDVYNSHSEGGAFKNIKGLLDEHFSLELPRVLGSHLALQSLRSAFPGDVHRVASLSDLIALELGQGSHLVMVRLQPVDGAPDAEAAIASNDKLMGEVSTHLQKNNVKFTAIYTARTSEKREKREAHQTRQLMATLQDATADGVFFNVSYSSSNSSSTVFAYLSYITVCAVPGFTRDHNKPEYCLVNFTLDATKLKDANLTVGPVMNNTVPVLLEVNNIETNYSSSSTFNLTIRMPFKNALDRWEILDAEVTLYNNSDVMVKDALMVTRGYDSVVPLLYSFHCSSMEWFPKNTSTSIAPYVTLGGFQIQPFNVIGDKFLLPVDCLGWFSTAIWMSLVPVSINVVILLFGMYMIMSLTTNDRFDDPKGKPLTVNSGE